MSNFRPYSTVIIYINSLARSWDWQQ